MEQLIFAIQTGRRKGRITRRQGDKIDNRFGKKQGPKAKTKAQIIYNSVGKVKWLGVKGQGESIKVTTTLGVRVKI